MGIENMAGGTSGRVHCIGVVFSWGARVSKYEKAIDALSKILWTKDCGIDGRNEKGEFVNFAADERDAMYRFAKETLLDIEPSKVQIADRRERE
jgi:hypothetical protein